MTHTRNRRRRIAIVRYKLAARRYRRRLCNYAEMETARAAMLAACGYDRPYSYMGEFTNLHERDFPSFIRATAQPCRYDRHHADAGRIYRYSGWQTPVTLAEHIETMRRERRRALELQRVLERPPAERFLHGWTVGGKIGGAWRMMAWRAGRVFVLRLADKEFVLGGYIPESNFKASRRRAMAFFKSISDPAFQEIYDETGLIPPVA